MADQLYAEFVSADADKVEIIYSKFVSLINSQPTVQTMLPLTPQVQMLIFHSRPLTMQVFAFLFPAKDWSCLDINILLFLIKCWHRLGVKVILKKLPVCKRILENHKSN